MYISYPPSSYSGILSMIHMKLGDSRFAKKTKFFFLSQGSLSLILEERVAPGKKGTRVAKKFFLLHHILYTRTY